MAIIRFLSEQRQPVPGVEVARAVSIPSGTAMCHLVTLEDDRMVRRVGEHWELGDGMAILWARRKSQIESGIDRMKTNLSDIGA
ncbi:IclR family transcriptional regulator [Desulfobacter hydrogenophilus]|uniref:IclR family transcriptional regulator n=2 Tax=Desulfobacter hydrogenophilus TaxID=2291 RepID=A0A328F6J4_9BACT|nr:helix-turn-helix domain-containing protein [Desulfobacter hydrogenophilus]QBH15628.1 IclR family transcriptional regulator [Desulfobacter hydrogenophilus]RAL99988.1 IclR family transcriptional regulator [Desulfobacter hydrogenophilus]